MSTRIEELIAFLEKTYPDTATALKDLSHNERIEYFAKLEMIAFIKLKVTPTKAPHGKAKN